MGYLMAYQNDSAMRVDVVMFRVPCFSANVSIFGGCLCSPTLHIFWSQNSQHIYLHLGYSTSFGLPVM
jgi:hypothetical protein